MSADPDAAPDALPVPPPLTPQLRALSDRFSGARESDYESLASRDLVLLASADASAINGALAERYASDEIYTNIGQVLICVNPYTMLQRGGLSLYDDSVAIDFRNGERTLQLEPHIFGIAADAFSEVLKTHEPQCIVVSGDSGAGKTEACKQIMGFITVVEDEEAAAAAAPALGAGAAEHRRATRRGSSVYFPPGAPQPNLGAHARDRIPAAVAEGGAGGGGAPGGGVVSSMNRLMYQLLESNTVLEAFGNAQTVRNNNSSRFGKYVEIQFRYGGKVAGGRITEYLLEKVRVIEQKPAERNYHIFYQLLASAGAGELPPELQPAEHYAYLANERRTIDGVDDAKGFASLCSSLELLGVGADVRSDMFALLGAVLTLGNIEFAADESGNARVSDASRSDLDVAASLLGMGAAKDLEAALVTRQMQMGGRSSVAIKPLDCAQAAVTRDTLAQSTYQRLFGWVVRRINTEIESGEKSLCPIGLLDIYGFEIFDQNSLEQFFINYVNEKLQQLFIETILQKQQEEYVTEGITWTSVTYFNNKVVCDLIERRPGGMMALVDEQCTFGSSTATKLMTALRTQHGDHRHFTPPKSEHDTRFEIKHYAGVVQYDSAQFLDKNRDTLFSDLVSLMNGSSRALATELFPLRTTAERSKRPPTACMQFKTQVTSLMQALHGSNAHYVRCLKPNESKKPGEYDRERMEQQIVFMGLPENVRIAQAGYAYRETFVGFLWRYKMICKETWPMPPKGTSNGAACAMVMASAGFGEPGETESAQFALGNTKIFIKRVEPLATLEQMRHEKLLPIVWRIQARGRAYVGRRLFLAQKRGVSRMAAEHHRRVATAKWAAQKRGVIVIQRRGRGLVQRKRWLLYKAQMYASFQINAWVRMVLCRKRLPDGWVARIREAGEAVRRRKRAAVTRIAAEWRMFVARRAYIRTCAATRLAGTWRRYVAIQAFKRAVAAIKLSKVARGALARREFRKARAAQAVIAARLRALLARARKKVILQRRLLQFKMMMLDGVRLKQRERGGPKTRDKKLWLSPEFDVLKVSWEKGGADSKRNPPIPVHTIREVKALKQRGGYSAAASFPLSINSKATGVIEYEAPTGRIREQLIFGLRMLSQLPTHQAGDVQRHGVQHRAQGGHARGASAAGTRSRGASHVDAEVKPSAALQRFGNSAPGSEAKAQATPGGFVSVGQAASSSKPWTPASKAAAAKAAGRPAAGSAAALAAGALGGSKRHSRVGWQPALGVGGGGSSHARSGSNLSVASAPAAPGVGGSPIPNPRASEDAAALMAVDASDFIAYDELKARTDLTDREKYLSDADFVQVFGCDKQAWAAMPGWKRKQAKKKADLF